MRLNLNYITLALSTIALANAKLIMIIRHGEKLNDKVTDLSPRGKARAQCLINLFGENGVFLQPEHIYAQSPSEKKQSTRPRDTVTPLSEAIGIPINLDYTSGQVKKLAKSIENSTDNKVVLISWSNDNIPDIAEKFGIVNPPDWDSNTFDDIWMLYDDATTSFYRNNVSKRTTYSGTDGFTMEIVKQNIDDCINENVKNFKVTSTSSEGNSNSASGSSRSVHFTSSLFIAIVGVFIYFIAAFY